MMTCIIVIDLHDTVLSCYLTLNLLELQLVVGLLLVRYYYGLENKLVSTDTVLQLIICFFK